MTRLLQSLLFTIAVLPALTLAATPSDLPIAYTLKFPFLGDGNSRVLDFHQTRGLSVAAVRKPDEPGLHARAAEGEIEWRDIWAYFTGPRTQGRIAVYENQNAKMLDNPEYRFLVEQPLEAFEPGKPYGLRPQWQAGELDSDFRRGDKDATIAGLDAEHYVATLAFDYDFGAGDETPAEHFEFQRDFWFAPALPYSRLQTQHLGQHLFLDASDDRLEYAAGRLHDAVLAGWSRGCAKPACWSRLASNTATRPSSPQSRTFAARPPSTRSRLAKRPCCAPGINICP